MLQVNHPIVVTMKGELVFGIEEYSTLEMDVYDYDQTFERKSTFITSYIYYLLL